MSEARQGMSVDIYVPVVMCMYDTLVLSHAGYIQVFPLSLSPPFFGWFLESIRGVLSTTFGVEVERDGGLVHMSPAMKIIEKVP